MSASTVYYWSRVSI